MFRFFHRWLDNRSPTPRRMTHLVEVREGRRVEVMPWSLFAMERAEGHFSARAIWRGYGEERFRRVYPKTNPTR